MTIPIIAAETTHTRMLSKAPVGLRIPSRYVPNSVILPMFATVAANEAEKVAPGITLVDVQMIGATGRLFLSGTLEDCTRARNRIDAVLGAVEGRSATR